VDQLKDLADHRLLQGCIYCGGAAETKDHVPSRILLDQPFPENVHVVPACRSCNNGFSRDEEYLACLIECAIAGSTNPDSILRPRVASILKRKPALRSRIEAAKRVVDGKTVFFAEEARFQNVLLKLARGHAAFDLSSTVRREPTLLMWWPMSMMSEKQRDSFDAAHVTELLGEIGSRGMQRMQITQLLLQSPSGELAALDLVINDWVDVQEGRYRYLAVDDTSGVRIKIVIAEFLACEVHWDDER
jgi:hypothetical protein